MSADPTIHTIQAVHAVEADYLDLDQAAQRLPGRPDRSTVYRYITHGRKLCGQRIRLRGVPGGRGKFFTTSTWLTQFIADMDAALARAAEAGVPVIAPPPTTRQVSRRQRQIESAMQRLLAKPKRQRSVR